MLYLLRGHVNFLRPENTCNGTLHLLSASSARRYMFQYCIVDYWHAKAVMCHRVGLNADSTISGTRIFP